MAHTPGRCEHCGQHYNAAHDNGRLTLRNAELLEALKEVTRWLGNAREYTYDGVLIDMNEAAHRRVMVDARAAIAKAKGQ